MAPRRICKRPAPSHPQRHAAQDSRHPSRLAHQPRGQPPRDTGLGAEIQRPTSSRRPDPHVPEQIARLQKSNRPRSRNGRGAARPDLRGQVHSGSRTQRDKLDHVAHRATFRSASRNIAIASKLSRRPSNAKTSAAMGDGRSSDTPHRQVANRSVRSATTPGGLTERMA